MLTEISLCTTINGSCFFAYFHRTIAFSFIKQFIKRLIKTTSCSNYSVYGSFLIIFLHTVFLKSLSVTDMIKLNLIRLLSMAGKTLLTSSLRKYFAAQVTLDDVK